MLMINFDVYKIYLSNYFIWVDFDNIFKITF